MSEETKKKLRKPKSEQGRKNIAEATRKPERIAKIILTSTGRKHSEETKKKMSDNYADISGKNNPMFKLGGAHKKETKELIS